MLSIDYVKENQKEYEKMLARRGSDFDLKTFLKVDANFKQSQQKQEEIQARRNQLSKERTPEAIERAKKLKQDYVDISDITSKLNKRRDEMWGYMPNILDERVPDGKSDKDNVEVKRVGNIKKFDFTPKWHDELGKELGILDAAAGVKVAGSGFYYWKGLGAKLVDSVLRLAEDIMEERGYTKFHTPILAKPNTFFGTGYLPFAADQLFTVSNDGISLIGTSEQVLVAYHQNEVIDLETPKKYTATTPCFRTEAGSYGKETKGVFRVHQFHKAEQIIFCKPEESKHWHDYCTETEELILKALEIPYRVVNVCTGDLGAAASMKYDIEGWFAAYGDYRELTSNSNLLEYQTRRLNVKYKKPDGKLAYAHTISATAITERAVLAILEYNQTKEGEVELPRALWPYMKGIKKITKQNK